MYYSGEGKYKHSDGTVSELHCGKTLHPIVIELERYKDGKSSLQEAFTNIYMYSKGDSDLYGGPEEFGLTPYTIHSLARMISKFESSNKVED